jgi:predicted  nucleic acid-binding Zn-ribbon protein
MGGSRRRPHRGQVTKGKETLETLRQERFELKGTIDQLETEVMYWKDVFKEATEKSGMNHEEMQEIMVSIQKNSRAVVVGGEGLPGGRSGRDGSGGGMLPDVIQKADKGQLGTMLVSLKDAYDILSNHHDRVLENLEKFLGDMEFKMDEITDLNWEIKTLKRRIEKGPEGKKSVMLDENGK